MKRKSESRKKSSTFFASLRRKSMQSG